jgi:hypothetical protein
MGVSGQHDTLAALYPWGESPLHPLDRRLGGPQSWSGQRLEEKFSASVRDRTPIVQSVVSHYTDWATPAPFLSTIFLDFSLQMLVETEGSTTSSLCVYIWEGEETAALYIYVYLLVQFMHFQMLL